MSRPPRIPPPPSRGGTPPRVSVCIPVFNGAEYIGESIESVLGQTLSDFELIVCDNCSTDATADVVGRFTDPRITYLRNPRNLGIAGNANRCLELARGEYISIWHHDDVMLPENLERKVRLLEEHPSVGFVHSDLILIDAKGRPLGRRWNDESIRDYVEPGLSIFRRYVANMPIGGLIFIGSVLARRACYERLGGFLPELPNCHDSEMWMRIALYNHVACLGTPLIKWRQHTTSATQVSSTLRGAAYLRQHYDAVYTPFRDHRARIPDHEGSLRHVSARFAEEAIRGSWSAFHRRDFPLAADYLRAAVRVHPRILTTTSFWPLAARVAAGPAGSKLYRALRHTFRRSL